MPTFEYACPACSFFGERFDIPVEERDNQYCPVCKEKLARQLSLPHFHLKGGGWSKDGYSTLVGDSPQHKELAKIAKAQKTENDRAGGRTK